MNQITLIKPAAGNVRGTVLTVCDAAEAKGERKKVSPEVAQRLIARGKAVEGTCPDTRDKKVCDEAHKRACETSLAESRSPVAKANAEAKLGKKPEKAKA